mgnify:CR=1 FL=1
MAQVFEGKSVNEEIVAKAASGDYEGRFREIMADPSNAHIPRVPDAGKVKDGALVMHNGIKVHVGDMAYYDQFSEILMLNKGVHEPQEERAFGEVLNFVTSGSVMVELGAYWSFYSMWFLQAVPDGRCFMVEPNARWLEVGVENFRLNQLQGDFTQAAVGREGLKLDEFVKNKGIDTVEILHADIQGHELEMLDGAEGLFARGGVKFAFVSTHSQALHFACLQRLQNRNFDILASVDFDNETYCFDGVIVAKLNSVRGPEPMVLDVRDPSQGLSIRRCGAVS